MGKFRPPPAPPSVRPRPVRSTAAILPALLLLAAGLAGCEKPPPATYDPMAHQIVREAFTSLANDPPPQTLRQLRRLQDTLPGQPFPAMALRQEELRQVFGQLNVRLQRGDLDGARQLVALAQKRLSPLPELVRAEKLLDGLAAMAACQAAAKVAEPNAEAYAAAFAEVTRRKAQLDSSPTFRAWYAARQAALDQLLRREARQRLAAVTLAAERDWLPGQRLPAATRTALTQAAAAAGLQGLQSEALNCLLRGRPAPADLAAEPLVWADPDARRFLEMVLARDWAALDPALRAGLQPRLAAAEPLGPSGSLLRARAALSRGDGAAFQSWCDRLGPQQAAFAPVLAADALAAAGLGRTQVNANPWLAPVPSATDFLKRLIQLGETRPAAGR